MASISATNKKQGEAADGTGIRIGTCLINRWRVRINREGLYNVKTCAPKEGAPRRGSPKKGENNKEMKLLGRDLRTGAIHNVPEWIIIIYEGSFSCKSL